ncbi:hypothetical protein [Pseudomonas sp. SBB6]|uniref:hypothetical protein n=1 Tax=Pseudomonas sp. SBB6 TaxID=2962032 RepID=UPI0020B823B2|nr:hypothetical protein [Pseudomonas sp. SBB6]MCP3750879.1 hypothetical protein [Pseudomonas sp. SBB6]
MKTRNLLTLAVAGMLCNSLAFANVDIFRAVDRKNTTYAKVADSQWRIDPDGLSTFELPNLNVNNKACKVRFTVVGVASKPAAHTQGNILNMAGYIGVYTPEYGEGHWSITRTAGAALPADITAYVLGNNAASINTGYTGSSTSQCLTPDAAN